MFRGRLFFVGVFVFLALTYFLNYSVVWKAHQDFSSYFWDCSVPHPSVWGCQILRKSPLLPSCSLLLVSQNVNEHISQNVNRNVNQNVNRNVNKSVNQNVNKDVNRNVNRNVSWEPNFRYTMICYIIENKPRRLKWTPHYQMSAENPISGTQRYVT